MKTVKHDSTIEYNLNEVMFLFGIGAVIQQKQWWPRGTLFTISAIKYNWQPGRHWIELRYDGDKVGGVQWNVQDPHKRIQVVKYQNDLLN